jgi:hypothetical protein
LQIWHGIRDIDYMLADFIQFGIVFCSDSDQACLSGTNFKQVRVDLIVERIVFSDS